MTIPSNPTASATSLTLTVPGINTDTGATKVNAGTKRFARVTAVRS